MTRSVVARSSRAIDLVSLILILGGAALYARAFLGMDRVRQSTDTRFTRGTMEAYALTNQYLRFQRLSYLGLGLVGVGVAVALSAAVHAHKIGKRQDAVRQHTE